ncbi:hypothetical protein ACMGD3_09805 [Lysinibacillus sphaericus]|uniref:hypothetical protein n=1 Tax=Lysinibacillus sphaericus TaxID=1421 RepID=UPI003F79BF9D
MNSVLQEQKRLKSGMEIMKERISRLEEETSHPQNEVFTIRKYVEDEIKGHIDTFDDCLKTIIGLRQEVQASP